MKTNRREWLAALLSLPILSKIGLKKALLRPVVSGRTTSDSVAIVEYWRVGPISDGRYLAGDPGSMYWHGKSPLAYLPYVGPLPWEKQA